MFDDSKSNPKAEKLERLGERLNERLLGKKQSLKAMWDKIGEHPELDKPTPMPDNVYLGCAQKDIEVPENSYCSSNKCTTRPSQERKTTTQYTFMFLHQKFKPVKDSAQSIKAWAYNTTGHIEQPVERYLELSGKEESELKPVETPCLDDHMFPPEDFQAKGKLSPVAARIVFNAM